jgi:tetratricopeptide (TPR) repeat protein
MRARDQGQGSAGAAAAPAPAPPRRPPDPPADPHRHLSLESMARLLTGRADPELITRELLPHLAARSPAFSRQMAELHLLMREAWHWDAELAVTEWLDAPAAWERLAALPHADQLSAVEADESCHTWGLCRLLERLSARSAAGNPTQAARLASLSLRISRHLGPAYGPEWIRDLQALALGRLADARRRLGELESAADALDAAETERQAGTGGPAVLAELLPLAALLRRDQHRLADAVDLLDRAIDLRRAARPGPTDDLGLDDPHRAGEAALDRAWCLYHLGDPASALGGLEQAERDLDPDREPRLTLGLRCGLVWSALALGRTAAAAERLGAAMTLAERLGVVAAALRLHHAEARLALAAGEREAAARALADTARAFGRLGLAVDAALAVLDLAALCLDAPPAAAADSAAAAAAAAAAGRDDVARQLLRGAAEHTLTLLGAPDLTGQGVQAVIDFVAACRAGRLTRDHLERWAGVLELARRPSVSWWSAWGTVLSRPGAGDAR